MPTIYTFGDPQLLREALLALATIFNLVEWGDPANPLGLGGNMLAVALIGLLAVVIAGVTSQQVRVDYLFMSLILFGVMFATDTDVNVEDIQTGDAAIVADVPIGIAYVAAAASSASRSLTETTSVALQRPGSTTSILTQDGFLNPFKMLLAIRDMSVSDLSDLTYKSLLEYYKICVGRTIATSPGTFDMDRFKADPSPLTFLLAPANVLNFSVTYYNAAAPGGVAQSCALTGPAILADINNLTTGAVDGIEAWVARSMGSANYNTNYNLADVDNAVDIVFRGTLTSQEFMGDLLVRNFHNTGEAWRTAEYGTNQAQYVATVTEAFETQRVTSATEGTVFLEFMLPLMTFFQFLFFSMAPFIALVMVASPFAATKVLGMYLLFGVWSYMWMPVAAIINHYMEISLQNAIEFAGTGLMNTGHTALLGFDDFYNIVTTKLVIGSNALAATPVIVGAVLTGAVFGVSNIASRLGSTSGKVNTAVSAPSLAQNQPLVAMGGRASFPYGSVAALRSADSGAASAPQKTAYEQIRFQQAGRSLTSAGNSIRQSAEREFSTKVSSGVSTLNDVVKSGGFGSTFTQAYQTSSTQAIYTAIEKGFGHDVREELTGSQARQLAGSLGLQALGTGIQESTQDTVIASKRFGELERYVQSQRGAITADVNSSLAASGTTDEKTAGSLRKSASEMRSAQREYETSQEVARDMGEKGEMLFEYSKGSMVDTTEVVGLGVRRLGNSGAKALLKSTLASYGPEMQNAVDKGGEALFAQKRPIGLDMRDDHVADDMDWMASRFNYLSNKAATGDSKAAHALLSLTNAFAGVGNVAGLEQNAGLIDGAGAARSALSNVEAEFKSIEDEMGSAGPGAAFGSIVDEATTLRESAGGSEMPLIDEGRIEAVQRQSEQGRSVVGDPGTLRDLAPDLIGGAGAMSSRQDSLTAGAATESSASGTIEGWLKPGAGFNDVLHNELAPLAGMDGNLRSTDAAADRAIDSLQGALMGQFHTQTDIAPIYEEYQELGFSKKQAALATYGELGRRTPGYSDLLVAGLTGAIGERSANAVGMARGLNKSLLSVARVGGFVTGVGIFAAGVGTAQYFSGKDATAAAQALGEDLKADFRKVNPQGYEEFAAAIDDQKDIEGVTRVLTEFYQTQKLTDAQIDQFNETGPTYYVRGEPTGGLEKAANPFSEANFTVTNAGPRREE